MINVQDFLKENISKDSIGEYASVLYDGKKIFVYFAHYILDGEDFFLESPCSLYKVSDVKGDVDKFCKNFVNETIEEFEDCVDIDLYIEQFVKPMIVDNILYEIENFQCEPFLPKLVDDIKLITERECLKELLNLKQE